MDNHINIEDAEETKKFLKELEYLLGNVEKVNAKLKGDLVIKEAEQTDLLHEIELSKLNARELIKVASRLKKVRIERRIIKDKLEYINTLKMFTDKYNNTLKIYADISNELKSLDILEVRKENRIYRPRVLKDLKVSKNINIKENGGTEENEQKNISNRSTEI